ncbi:MAG: glycosyltransferase family 10 domain-containing protein [Rubripirellula sp.]
MRQTPGSLGVWEDFVFVTDPAEGSFDAWVVLDNPPMPVTATCNRENLFFVSWEPPEIRTFHRGFLTQFRWVQTCHPCKHPGLIESQQSQPWHAGVEVADGFLPNLDYDQLARMSPPEKSELVSVIISNKVTTEAHRQRLEFVRMLKSRLGDKLHVYGRGHNDIADKWVALKDYRYHIVLENASRRNYITEKLTDAFLGYCFPFYFGAPNAHDYFPSESFAAIDVFRIDEAIETICSLIASDRDVQRRSAIERARQVVLGELNLFPMLANLVRDKMVHGRRDQLTVYPKKNRVKIGVSNISRALRVAA